MKFLQHRRMVAMARKVQPTYDYTTGEPLAAVLPPRPLGVHGQKLWDAVQAEYRIVDIAGRETLAQICVMLDRAEELAEQLNSDGRTVRTKFTTKCHPAIKEEIACRKFIVQGFKDLGISVEALKTHLGSKPRSNDQAFEVDIPDFD
jgi:hypothetical protein